LKLDNPALIDATTALRKNHKLKLPDAVIAATALLNHCPLVSNDRELEKVPNLTIVRF
jgi:predicted nucleic acid-binding protein